MNSLEAFRAGFVSDGCTGFVDWWRGIFLRPCCEAHDLSWWLHPGDWGVWLASNLELSACVVTAGAWELAALFFAATMSVGALLFAGAAQRTKRRQLPRNGA